RACSSAPARREGPDAPPAAGRRRVRSARVRAGSCGWRCGVLASANYPLHEAQLGAQLGQAAAADFEGVLTVAKHGVDVAVAIAAQLHQLMAGDQAVAVDAHETFAELV